MSFGTVQAEKMTTESGYSLGAGNASSFKNRLINGAMTVDQRYAGTAYSPANGYSVDRWTSGYYAPAGGTYSAQQVVDAPAGFYNSLKMTVTATPSNNTDAFFQLYQPIEANNVADFGLGTANAKSFTFSFWVKSSLTGTFCVAFGNNTSPAYYYVSTYTINTANTWELKTITVTAPTAGTWGTTSGQGLSVYFDLGSGTTQDAPSANTWNSGNYRRVSSGVRLINTNGATLNVTGCQLEVGTVATSFDQRSISTELGLCYRYCFAWRTDALGYTQYGRLPAAFVTGTTSCTTSIFLPQPMRSTAYSLTWNNKAYQEYYLTGAGATGSTITLNTDANGINWVTLNLSFTGTALPTTQGIVAGVRFTNVTDGALIISTEL